ncbi:MAG: 3'-5' exonuclease [Proteobacteria bacterium]|nr:3'-5' exonuclease [Pseudomonadota bacterium]
METAAPEATATVADTATAVAVERPLVLLYDTETQGLPDWKSPSGGEQQPHIVELYAALADAESGHIVDELHAIVKPEGWTIPDDVAAVHGITTERATLEGQPEALVFTRFLQMHARAKERVGHNESFDARIMRIAHKRYRSDEEADAFKAAPAFCTMRAMTDHCKLPGKRGGYKFPSLSEAYQHFFGRPLEGAHSARTDALAAGKLYFALKGTIVTWG